MTTTVEKATQYIVDASELINKKFEHIDGNRRIEVIYRVADLTSRIECTAALVAAIHELRDSIRLLKGDTK